MHSNKIIFLSVLAVGAGMALGPAAAATRSFPAMPSCQSVGRAIEAAYGPIGRVEDDTAGAHEVEKESTGLPYHVLRACSIYVPGHRVPLSVTFNAPMSRQFIEGMSRMSKSMGLKVRKLDGSSYGDLAYLTPQIGGGNAVTALVGDVGIAITTWARAKEVRNMAEHIVALIK